MTPSCTCGICEKCVKNLKMRVYRATLPRKQRPETALSRRMNAIADEVWKRHEMRDYYAPASERFRGFGGLAIDRVAHL